jgi:hypothetical protein
MNIDGSNTLDESDSNALESGKVGGNSCHFSGHEWMLLYLSAVELPEPDICLEE